MAYCNDPISDMLARIRNAILARKASVQIPGSRLKLKLAEILKNEGYIQSFVFDKDNRQGILTVELKWESPGHSAISGMRRISRPGRRWYSSRREIPRVQSGLGIAILSTSRGVMSDKSARRQRVGGEVLCEVW